MLYLARAMIVLIHKCTNGWTLVSRRLGCAKLSKE